MELTYTFYCDVAPHQPGSVRITAGFKEDTAPLFDVVLSKDDAKAAVGRDITAMLKVAGLHPGEAQEVIGRMLHKIEGMP